MAIPPLALTLTSAQTLTMAPLVLALAVVLDPSCYSKASLKTKAMTAAAAAYGAGTVNNTTPSSAIALH